MTYISSLGLHSFLKSFSIVDHNDHNLSSTDFLSFQSLITVLRALPGSSLDHLIITSIYDTSFSASTHSYDDDDNDIDSDDHSDCNIGSDSHSDSANQNQLSSSAAQQPVDGDNSSDQCDEDDNDDRRSSSRSVEQRLIEYCEIEFHDDYSSIIDVLQQTM